MGLIFWMALIIQSCAAPDPVATFTGETMGTTYRVSYTADTTPAERRKEAVDSLLQEINLSMSTYIDASAISKLNASRDTSAIHPVDYHFATVYQKAKEVYMYSQGAFNPAVGPLVSAWGFGSAPAEDLLASQVDSLLLLCDFTAFQLDTLSLTIKKSNPGAQLDFSAIAKGYGVDAVAGLLEESGISDYFVEIGGEVRARGRHPEDRPWRIGIDKPIAAGPQAREIQLAVELQDQSLATSGNYRNFYVRNGRKYVHTINPYTGYAEESDLLSASVLAEDCMTADAYATAFMVLGKEKALALAEERPGIEAYFITSDEQGNYEETRTSGFPPAVPTQ